MECIRASYLERPKGDSLNLSFTCSFVSFSCYTSAPVSYFSLQTSSLLALQHTKPPNMQPSPKCLPWLPSLRISQHSFYSPVTQFVPNSKILGRKSDWPSYGHMSSLFLAAVSSDPTVEGDPTVEASPFPRQGCGKGRMGKPLWYSSFLAFCQISYMSSTPDWEFLVHLCISCAEQSILRIHSIRGTEMIHNKNNI